jgi:hypothetical protein
MPVESPKIEKFICACDQKVTGWNSVNVNVQFVRKLIALIYDSHPPSRDTGALGPEAPDCAEVLGCMGPIFTVSS